MLRCWSHCSWRCSGNVWTWCFGPGFNDLVLGQWFDRMVLESFSNQNSSVSLWLPRTKWKQILCSGAWAVQTFCRFWASRTWISESNITSPSLRQRSAAMQMGGLLPRVPEHLKWSPEQTKHRSNVLNNDIQQQACLSDKVNEITGSDLIPGSAVGR